MGCDGGTIPRRDELVRVKKKAEVKDRESELNFQWRYCAITQQLLQEPIVACHLGRLYNKLALIEALLNKDTLPESLQHIKNLKDVVTLNLTKNPAYKEETNHTSNAAPYICPVIGLEMSGKFRFIALWSCGCVFSERALKEISTQVCHKCQKPFQDNDVVVLNGNEEDLAVMNRNMETRQERKKNKEKKKKAKLHGISEDDSDSLSKKPETITSNPSTSDESIKKPITDDKQTKSVSIKSSTITNGPSTSGESTKKPVIDEKQAKFTNNGLNLKRPGSLKEPSDAAKKMKPQYSLSKDPNVSDVYKSIFTSHKSEKEQTRAHWVTYNPFYN